MVKSLFKIDKTKIVAKMASPAVAAAKRLNSLFLRSRCSLRHGNKLMRAISQTPLKPIHTLPSGLVHLFGA
ncbi:hypothetical protein [Moraxella lacunata]|uniref:hypothetical protein n=1 Tax=Moraxella lacunata TaxID=477 RepID=UPI003EDFE03C